MPTIGPQGEHGLLATYGFAIVIYCDFSGYSDIARGLGKLMGIDIMRNFDLPYLATNPPEFWRKWHMSLSFWFRDYLFLPVSYALTRHIQRETIFGIKARIWVYILASLATMLLCGLWHGAAWTFVIWGAYHGVLLVGSSIVRCRLGVACEGSSLRQAESIKACR